MIRMLAAAGTFALIVSGAMAQQAGAPAQLIPAAQPAMASRSQPVATTPTPAPAASLSWNQARARIEARGYSDVRGLTQDGAGGWRGKATRDGKPVSVSVAPAGDVNAR